MINYELDTLPFLLTNQQRRALNRSMPHYNEQCQVTTEITISQNHKDNHPIGSIPSNLGEPWGPSVFGPVKLLNI